MKRFLISIFAIVLFSLTVQAQDQVTISWDMPDNWDYTDNQVQLNLEVDNSASFNEVTGIISATLTNSDGELKELLHARFPQRGNPSEIDNRKWSYVDRTAGDKTYFTYNVRYTDGDNQNGFLAGEDWLMLEEFFILEKWPTYGQLEIEFSNIEVTNTDNEILTSNSRAFINISFGNKPVPDPPIFELVATVPLTEDTEKWPVQLWVTNPNHEISGFYSPDFRVNECLKFTNMEMNYDWSNPEFSLIRKMEEGYVYGMKTEASSPDDYIEKGPRRYLATLWFEVSNGCLTKGDLAEIAWYITSVTEDGDVNNLIGINDASMITTVLAGEKPPLDPPKFELIPTIPLTEDTEDWSIQLWVTNPDHEISGFYTPDFRINRCLKVTKMEMDYNWSNAVFSQIGQTEKGLVYEMVTIANSPSDYIEKGPRRQIATLWFKVSKGCLTQGDLAEIAWQITTVTDGANNMLRIDDFSIAIPVLAGDKPPLDPPRFEFAVVSNLQEDTEEYSIQLWITNPDHEISGLYFSDLRIDQCLKFNKFKFLSSSIDYTWSDPIFEQIGETNEGIVYEMTTETNDPSYYIEKGPRRHLATFWFNVVDDCLVKDELATLAWYNTKITDGEASADSIRINDFAITVLIRAGATQDSCVKGDVNFDDKIDIDDVIIVLQHITLAKQLDDNQVCPADYNSNDKVNMTDAMNIMIIASDDLRIYDTYPVDNVITLNGAGALIITGKNLTEATLSLSGQGGSFTTTSEFMGDSAYVLKFNDSYRYYGKITINSDAIIEDGYQITAVSSGIEENDDSIALNAFPNPFTDNCTIAYHLPYGAQVELTIYNTIGNVVAVLVNEYQQEGGYLAHFRPEANISAGLYFYRIMTSNWDDMNINIQSSDNSGVHVSGTTEQAHIQSGMITYRP